MHITRFLEDRLAGLLAPGKVLVLYGPRQAGKTTLIHTFLAGFTGRYYLGTGEDHELRRILESGSRARIVSAFRGYDLIVIDEAQHIRDVGLGLKMLVDSLPDVRVLASGSSSFEPANRLGEPLTGRQRLLTLFPVAFRELAALHGPMRALEMRDQLLVYGSYPEVLTAPNDRERREILLALSEAYLFKDILAFERIRNPRKLTDLLRLLAFQIGKEVSLNELAGSLGIAKQTVARYLDLLEKTFVLKRLGGFSRNLRKEVTKSSRYYFWDTGIRNALISNFNDLALRDDAGMLWKNFLFIERVKRQAYRRVPCNTYFWRTYDRKEIDLVEERDGRLHGYEFKWGRKRPRPPRPWLETYDNATYQVIDRENYLEFVS